MLKFDNYSYKPKSCIACGIEIVGRSDKKFCCDICRNNYNNNLNKIRNEKIKTTNIILSKNRSILNSFINEKTKTPSKSKLIDAGFNFHFMTQQFTDSKGRQIYKCYDLGYYFDKDLIKIIE